MRRFFITSRGFGITQGLLYGRTGILSTKVLVLSVRCWILAVAAVSGFDDRLLGVSFRGLTAYRVLYD